MSAIYLTDKNFESEVLQSDKPVLVDFWAEWCGPCKMMSPIIDQVADEVSDVKICKVNVSEYQDLAVKYGVSSIPTLILFNEGKVSDTSIGAISKSEVLEFIKG